MTSAAAPRAFARSASSAPRCARTESDTGTGVRDPLDERAAPSPAITPEIEFKDSLFMSTELGPPLSTLIFVTAAQSPTRRIRRLGDPRTGHCDPFVVRLPASNFGEHVRSPRLT